jgi:hypothetical protein
MLLKKLYLLKMEIRKAASLVFLVVYFSACTSTNGKNDTPAAEEKGSGGLGEIVFREYEHDFGKVSEGEKVAYLFPYENKGAGNLVINSTSTSCGCTVSKYDTRPIPPGGKGTIEVVFNTSGRSGMQTKTVSVHTNSKKQVVTLKITAEVTGKE